MADLTIGQRIAQERKKLGLSQEGLGEKIGVSRQAISKWESDTAIPDIDKLIVLSKLVGVSIGWLLGVEEQPSQQETSLSETQVKTIEELIKKYYTAPVPLVSKWQRILAIGTAASIFLCLFTMQLHNARQEAAIQSKADISIYKEISTRLSALEDSVHSLSAPEQVLEGYTIEVLPLVVTNDHIVRAKVVFTAVPSVWNRGDTGYLCVSGGSMDAFRIKCTWDGGHLTATAILDVADGYDLCFAVEHTDDSQAQQILENAIIDDLEHQFTIPMYIDRGSHTFEDGTLTLKDFAVYFNTPPIYQSGETALTVSECEYRLYHYYHNNSERELIRSSMLEHCGYSTNSRYLYQVAGQPVRFENVSVRNCRQLGLEFYVKFSNGMERSFLITYLHPDGNGGLK